MQSGDRAAILLRRIFDRCRPCIAGDASPGRIFNETAGLPAAKPPIAKPSNQSALDTSAGAQLYSSIAGFESSVFAYQSVLE